MRKLSLTVIALFLLVLPLVAQKYEAAWRNWQRNTSRKKIYIHYDKEYYVAGETIWFKAYLYSDGKPSAAANNLYLQFTDSKGRLVAVKKIPRSRSDCQGKYCYPRFAFPGETIT